MNIVLYQPEIPQNTGNIGRLCWCTGTKLHIVGKPSFSMSDSAVKRAGLDYWPKLNPVLHEDWASFSSTVPDPSRMILLTRFAEISYSDFKFDLDDFIVLGRETSGLPEELVRDFKNKFPDNIVRIPVNEDCRSLNLGNAASIVLYEALRQNQFPKLKTSLPIP